jgi:hypothetical protein
MRDGDNAVNRNNGKAANYKVHAWLLNDPAQINAIYDSTARTSTS